MANVTIISDDTCDMQIDLIKKYKIKIIPVKMVFSDKTFKSCGVQGDLTLDEYYRRVEKELPTTSTPSLGIIHENFKQSLEQSDALIAIFISNSLSPIASNAQTVVNQYFPDKKIKIHNSNITSVGLSVLVLEAAKLAQKGLSFEEINKKIEKWLTQVHYAGIMFTLENLVRTGRVPKTKKYLADFFKVKPIVAMVDGQVTVKGKIRADDKLIINQIKKFGQLALENMSNESDYLFIGHTRWLEAAEDIAAYLKLHNPKNKTIIIQETGTLLANFVGKKTITLGYIGQYDDNWLLKTK